MRGKGTCVIALIIFYESNGTKPKTLYRVLSCVLYYPMKSYVCIDYLSCQPKKLIRISPNKIFEQPTYNKCLGIGITEVLLNLVSCHGIMEELNSIVILN